MTTDDTRPSDCGAAHPEHPGTHCRQPYGHRGPHMTARRDVEWDNAYLSAPGTPTFNLTRQDFDWLADYFSGYHGVPGLRARHAALVKAERECSGYYIGHDCGCTCHRAALDDTRPLTLETVERDLGRRNGSNRLMAEYVMGILDAERARHAALVAAAREMLAFIEASDDGHSYCDTQVGGGWVPEPVTCTCGHDELVGRWRAALDGEPR